MSTSFGDHLAAWIAAIVGPPVSNTSLIKRFTVAAGLGGGSRSADEVARLAAITEGRVRVLARLARAPRRLGLPAIPGWRDTCLTRAYASTLALRARGIPATLAFGVRADHNADEGVAAHAWVTVAGRPLVDPSAAQYAALSPSDRRPAEQPTA